MNSRLSSLGRRLICSNPVAASTARASSSVAAPETHPESSARSARISSGRTAVATTSAIARRPPGFSTRKASRKTAALSGERLITQFERMASTLRSATGRCSISPRRNSTFCRRLWRGVVARLRDHLGRHVHADDAARLADLSAARKQSKPPPLPRSSTVSPGRSAAMAWGLPQPRPRSAPSGTLSRSASE